MPPARAGHGSTGTVWQHSQQRMDPRTLLTPADPRCDDMPTPMSVPVWSMGLTSSEHPWAGPGSPTASRLAPGCSVPGRTAGCSTQPGLRAVGGLRELLAEAPPKEPPAAGPEWAWGAEWSPRTELDIGADRRMST
jgi:hypothetical protein